MTAPAELTRDAAEGASPRCGVCNHPEALHDPIARRYCAATMTNALSRNCICPNS